MTETELNAIQAQCKRGFPKHMIDDSNNLHADCYGAIGWLRHRLRELEGDRDRVDAVEKNRWAILVFERGPRAVVCTFTKEHHEGRNVREAIDKAIKSLSETPKPK